MIESMKHYHAHVYFEARHLDEARTWSAQAEGSGVFELVKFHARPVGPHPTGMVEAHFGEAQYEAALEWLDKNRGDFSVLVHRDTGDDYADHTNGIRWLGKSVPLDFGFFDLIQSRPDLKINPS